MGKTMELRHECYFFKALKHIINPIAEQITTLLKFFRLNLFILTDIIQKFSQRHLVVIFYTCTYIYTIFYFIILCTLLSFIIVCSYLHAAELYVCMWGGGGCTEHIMCFHISVKVSMYSRL